MWRLWFVLGGVVLGVVSHYSHSDPMAGVMGTMMVVFIVAIGVAILAFIYAGVSRLGRRAKGG